MIYAGIDAGSRTVKAVLFDADRQEVVAGGVVDQGVEQEQVAPALLDESERLLELPAGVAHEAVAPDRGRRESEIGASSDPGRDTHEGGGQHGRS